METVGLIRGNRSLPTLKLTYSGQEECCFTENRRLAKFEAHADRLGYYLRHRAGRDVWWHSDGLLRVSKDAAYLLSS